jgi:drug/metabolite transporter (DMT)-like permease
VGASALLLAIGAALVWGVSDFLGGFSSRTANPIVVSSLTQLGGLAAVTPILVFQGIGPDLRSWFWGTVAGLAGAVGIGALFFATARGVIAVVVPLAGATAAAVPVLFGFALGERLTVEGAVGILLGLFGMLVLSWPRFEQRSRLYTPLSIGLALVSGLSFGLYRAGIALTPGNSLWGPAIAQTVTFLLFVGIVAARWLKGYVDFNLSQSVVICSLASGILAFTAVLLYLEAIKSGPLTLVSILSSLYPAATVLLSMIVLGERLSGRQLFGVGLALAALGLLSRRSLANAQQVIGSYLRRFGPPNPNPGADHA